MDTQCSAIYCGPNQKVRSNNCVPCDLGTYHPGGHDSSGLDTECHKIRCNPNERVQRNVCVACELGSMAVGGSDASGADTRCSAITCMKGQRVHQKKCVSCARGKTSKAGHDASGDDTQCDVIVCSENERVHRNMCVPCPVGTTSKAGKDASAFDTECDVTFCQENERVSNHQCLACSKGKMAAVGHDARSIDTECFIRYCSKNERVQDNQCVPCAPGTYNEAGDEADAEDTYCMGRLVFCKPNQRVFGFQCVDCAPGTIRRGGDVSNGPNTECDAILCHNNERVSRNACVKCPLGMERIGGDTADGPDTTCTVNFCKVNFHVKDNRCIACNPGRITSGSHDPTGQDTDCERLLCGPGERVYRNKCIKCERGTTSEGGHDAGAYDTFCTEILCEENERVEGNECVSCQVGKANEKGDDASGVDTNCFSTYCKPNQYVKANVCMDCPPGSFALGIQDMSGEDTECSMHVCLKDQRVHQGECIECEPGKHNDEGDLPNGMDTVCSATFCAEDEHVHGNECFACEPGKYSDYRHDSSGEDSECDPIYCQENERVSSNECVKCPPGYFSEGGDDASGLNTGCKNIFVKQCGQIDMVFLLDASGSIGKENWELAKNYVEEIAVGIQIEPTAAHAGLIVFSDNATKVVDFQHGQEEALFLEKLFSTEYTTGDLTYINEAMDMARTEFFPYSMDFTRKSVMIITDGRQSGGSEIVVEAAQKLKDMGVGVYAVGVGLEVDKEELMQIVSEPENLLISGNFNDLTGLVEETVLLQCPAAAEIKDSLIEFMQAQEAGAGQNKDDDKTSSSWISEYADESCSAYAQGTANHNYCTDKGKGSDTRAACAACSECQGSPVCSSAPNPTMPPTMPPTTPPTSKPSTNAWMGFNGMPCSEYASTGQYYKYCNDEGTGSDTRSACLACRTECLGSPACATAEVAEVTATVEVTPAQSKPAADCDDLDSDYKKDCPNWAAQNECTESPDFMAYFCQKSCGLCPDAAPSMDARRSAPAPIVGNNLPANCGNYYYEQPITANPIVRCQDGTRWAADNNGNFWAIAAAEFSTQRTASSGVPTPTAYVQQPVNTFKRQYMYVNPVNQVLYSSKANGYSSFQGVPTQVQPQYVASPLPAASQHAFFHPVSDQRFQG